jgi:mono/diheme cytochrome c family protein
MRGILEVRGQAVTEPARPYLASDILLQHLDDPRDAGVVPAAVPSAIRGLPLYRQRCASCHGERGEGTGRAAAVARQEALADASPVDVFQILTGARMQRGSPQVGAHGRGVSTVSKAIPSHAQYARDWTEQERWDVVAALWSFTTTTDRLDLGQRLFLRNCAACHGERGAGDGPGGKHQPKKPANFTDARRMLAGTTTLYTAKIRRGGMGTGMPYWGSIFTEEELAVAKKQIANTLDEQMREPSFWLSRVGQMTFDGTNLDDVVEAPAAYQAFTAEQVRATFARYYSPQSSMAVVVLPAETK